ncbi:MAG: hypothetical protein ACRD2M_09395 [Terriglobales bacterium]
MTSIRKFSWLPLVLSACALAQDADLPDAPSARLTKPDPPMTFCQAAWQNGIPCSQTSEPSEYKARRAQTRPRFLLPDGTPVPLRLVRKVASNKVKPGEGVEFELVKDVRASGLLVMARGTRVVGYADSGTRGKNKFCGRGGTLSLTLSRAYAITGEEIPLRGGFDAAGAGFKSGNKVECFFNFLGQVAALYARVPVSVENVYLRENTVLTAAVHGDVYFDAELLASVSARVEQERQAQLALGRKTTLHVYRSDFDAAGNRRLFLRRRVSADDDMRPLTTGFTPRYAELERRPAHESWQALAARNAGLKVDGQQFRLAPDQTLRIELPPGIHKFRTDQSILEVELEEGGEYFLRVSVEPGFKNNTHAEFVTQDDAEYELFPSAGARLRR